MCEKNRNSKDCKGENIDLEVFKKGVMLSIKKLKDNQTLFKEMLLNGFKVSESSKKEIGDLSREIDGLKAKLEEITGRFDDFSCALKKTLMDELKDKTMAKLELENDLLVTGSAESRTRKIIKNLNAISPDAEYSVDLMASVYSRAYVIDKNNVILIIGNPDVSNLPYNLTGDLKVRVDYKIKCTDYHTDFSIFINK